jgi:hypothetical protein
MLAAAAKEELLLPPPVSKLPFDPPKLPLLDGARLLL